MACAGKNVQFVDLSKLPSKYRRQMADRLREQKEQQLLQQLALQQVQQAQQEEGAAGAQREEDEELLENDDEGEDKEGLVDKALGGGSSSSSTGGIVGSVSGTRRGRLAGMLERSLRRKVQVIRRQEDDAGLEADKVEEVEALDRKAQQELQQRRAAEAQRASDAEEPKSSGQRVLTGPEVRLA